LLKLRWISLTKKRIAQLLESEGIDLAYSKADTLTDIHIYDQIEKYIPALKGKNAESILLMVYRLSGIMRSSDNIEVASSRAAKVLFALKSFARMDSNQVPIQADIREGIETVLTLYSNQLKQGVELNRDFEEVPPIECIPDELNQVWTNLLHNALQAMDFQGTLSLSIAQVDDRIQVKFIDSGVGIPEESLEQIFEPFFTTKPAGEGSGLGLDISMQIVKRHHGDLRVVSEPGRTEFVVELPINSQIDEKVESHDA
jgi:two-component system NtrC family sensor kinase